MNINPLSSSSPSYGPSPSQKKELIDNLDALIAQLRAAMGPPLNEEKAHAVALKIENFLTAHKQEIFKIAQENGYLPTGGYNYENEFQTCLTSIQDVLQQPTDGDLDLLNEGLTQLTYYVSHPDIKH